MGSIRFPGKVMAEVHGRTLIAILLKRLKRATQIDKIVVATTDRQIDDVLAEHCQHLGFAVFRGSELDVLDRYYQAALQNKPEIVVRITGDCPLIDPQLVDEVIVDFKQGGADYVTNSAPATYPDGLDTEVFAFSALEQAWLNGKSDLEREHVTLYMRESGKFETRGRIGESDLSSHRWTVDDQSDFEVVRNVLEHFQPNVEFGWLEVLNLEQSQPALFKANKSHVRNKGTTMGTGQKLWQRAKKVIPGGNMLLSKRAEMFLPDQWPSYFSRARGCTVWDMDNRPYIDMCIMGIGTNTLGYGHPEVDEAARRVVEIGNMSTLNCPEEVYLAEKLIEMHPWADMARFARSGGEANAIAIRIARAATGKDKVAICGYHGWHDWYLSANLGDDKSLDGHLLPGLHPKGVPENLRGSVLPFAYNDLAALETLVSQHDIGTIKMEVVRSEEPQDNFLGKVRELADRHNIVLIFDECTSGFRETFGGLHKRFGVEPDMAMFGKALGNGYAITGTIGRREVMQAAQSTFISSTFWTERIGPAAALKTLEVMEREKSWETISKTGLDIRARWAELARKHELSVDFWGLSSLTGYTILGDNSLVYKTLATQEMLKKGYLTGNSVYVCTEHSPDIIDGYFNALDPVFALISECEQGRDVMSLLEGPVCHAGFKRLN